MPKLRSKLAETIVGTAWNRLREWNVGGPLDVAYEPDADGDLCLTSDPSYRGYASWAHRMEIMDWDETFDSAVAAKPRDQAEMQAIYAAVEYMALMENALLSLGLMMAFGPFENEAAEQLYCLHRFDALQRLVSATDRLRAVSLHGLFGLDENETVQLFRKKKFFKAFEIDKATESGVSGIRLRKKTFDRDAFWSVYQELWPFVKDKEAPVICLRKKRNTITHDLGTLPGSVMKSSAGKDTRLEVPYLVGVYRQLGYPRNRPLGIDREEIYHVKSDYNTVLRFGSCLFELEDIIFRGS